MLILKDVARPEPDMPGEVCKVNWGISSLVYFSVHSTVHRAELAAILIRIFMLKIVKSRQRRARIYHAFTSYPPNILITGRDAQLY